MFCKSVNLTDFRADAAGVLKPLHKPESKEVVQVVHRGSSIKVVMTQEYYFRLMEKIEAYEKHPNDPVSGRFDVSAGDDEELLEA